MVSSIKLFDKVLETETKRLEKIKTISDNREEIYRAACVAVVEENEQLISLVTAKIAEYIKGDLLGIDDPLKDEKN